MKRKTKIRKIKRAIKNTFLILVTSFAAIYAVLMGISLLTFDWTWKQLPVLLTIFLLCVEWLIIFLYANDAFKDDYHFLIKQEPDYDYDFED